jgi:uncharacterized protein (UPF0332 family)
MTIEECFQKKQLIKIIKSKQIALEDLERAEKFLGDGIDLAETDKKEMAFLALYQAIFHAARAILFKDGVKEKSHYCLQKYLEEKYSKLFTPEELALFDILRGIRQQIQYDIRKPQITQNPAELTDRTEQFIEKTKKHIKEKTSL